MKPAAGISSHLGAFALGIALAASITFIAKPGSPVGSVEKSLHSAGTSNGVAAHKTSKAGRETKRTVKQEDYPTAWNDVAARDLSIRDRKSLQKDILARWAQVDLAAALDAAMKETWDKGETTIARTSYFGDSLLTAFSQAFSDRPLEAWKLIQSGRYDIGAQLLRKQWLACVSKSDGDLVLSMLPEMPVALQTEAMEVHPDIEKLAEWGCELPQRPDTVELYHKAIDRYIRDDLSRAKEWLEAMPEGSWQRENGLAEFSRQAMQWKKDPVSSQWALDSIRDPEIKAAARKWRDDWEKQPGNRSR